MRCDEYTTKQKDFAAAEPVHSLLLLVRPLQGLSLMVPKFQSEIDPVGDCCFFVTASRFSYEKDIRLLVEY